MHSSKMRTARSSSHPRGGFHQAPLPFCYGLLVWWLFGVVAFWCGGLLVWWPSGVVAFWCHAFWCRGLLLWPSAPRRPYQKATKPEGHNRRHKRRPQQKAITEGHTPPQNQAPPQEQTPQDQTPWGADPPGTRHPQEETPLLQGMMGYHLQCMLG